ncbi:MAG: Holliday junction resolvase RuvX [Nitrospinota bacterium]
MEDRRKLPENAGTARILAVDLGSRRIGLAISDPLGVTAQPLPTLKAENFDANVEAVAAVAAEHEAKTIVVGLPLRMNGTAGKEARQAERFAEALRERSQLPVHTWDERLTTVASEKSLIAAGHRRKRRRAVIDSAASILILQGFLDSRKRRTPT